MWISYDWLVVLVAKPCPTFATPWAATCQAPLTMGFSGQEYWSGLPFPSPGDLPDPGIKPRSPALQADSLPTELRGKPPHREISLCIRMSPPSWASLPPHPHPTSLGHLWASSWSPRVMQQFPTSIYFTHGNEYTLKLLFQFIPHSPSPPAPTSPFSVEESCVHSKDFIQGSFW